MTQTAAVNAIALRQPAALTPLSGSLDAYISYVNRLPALDAVEEKRLAEKLRDDGDLAAAAGRRTSRGAPPRGGHLPR